MKFFVDENKLKAALAENKRLRANNKKLRAAFKPFLGLGASYDLIPYWRDIVLNANAVFNETDEQKLPEK